MRIATAVLLLAAFAVAGCRERREEPAPDYRGARDASDRSHQALDQESKK